LHDGFQLAKTRNDGVRASSAPYLVFLDGDCVAPRDHVAQHLRRRRQRTVMGGYCYYLDRVTSARIDKVAVEAGEFNDWPTLEQKKKLNRVDWKARFYALIRHPRRPKLYGGAFGIWRSDYEAINGFNEEYKGWGCEDDEFRMRLKRAGIRIRSILRWTRTYHLWHPPAASYPKRWQDGPNVEKLRRDAQGTSARCVNGLQKTAA
jgi:GT2 family glycosyltransferase